MSGLPWRTVLALSAAGAAIGAATLTGAFGSPVEFALWTAVAAFVWIPVALRRFPERALAGLAAVGLLAGVWTGAIQAGFADRLLAANAGYAASVGPTATAGARATLFGGAVAVGAVWGAVWGGGLAAFRAWKLKTAS